MDKIAAGLEFISEWTGRVVAWLVLAMVLLICYDVAMRYLFHHGSVALQELEWHLFGALFLLGAAYTLEHDEHVRVDVLHHGRFVTPRVRLWIDLLGGLFFLLPFCLTIIIGSWAFVHNSYLFNEGSPDPGGLSRRYLLKAMIPLGFGLLLLQGIAGILRAMDALRKSDTESIHTAGSRS